MSPAPRGPRPREAGFVLIGVIIFVLALTIIGISLFSLSSYEAQFLQRSLDGEQAFQSAVGGIERARFALCATSRLDAVSAAPGRENVIAATAFQVRGSDSISTGPVEWVANQTGPPARDRPGERPGAHDHGALHAAGGRPNYYRQLVTTSGRHRRWTRWASADPTCRTGPTVDLGGTVWEGTVASPADTLVWTARLRDWSLRRILTGQRGPCPTWPRTGRAHDPAAALPATSGARRRRRTSTTTTSTPTPASRPTTASRRASAPTPACTTCATARSDHRLAAAGCAVWVLPARRARS